MSKVTLAVKAAIVGSRLESLAKKARWLTGLPQRLKHPELCELCLEDKWLPMVLKRLLRPDSNVIDIGAHIGSFLSLACRNAPNGRHVAIEPSKIRSPILHKRFPSVRVMPLAISDHNGHSSFSERVNQPGFSQLNCPIEHKGTIRYDVITRCLDDLFLDEQVDLIKIDIEGNELAALNGGVKLIKQQRPNIIFECLPEYPSQQTDRNATFKFFVDQAYSIFTFGDFLFDKASLSLDEFRKCALYPFRAWNYIALPR